MVASINMIFICPRCEAPISATDKPKHCPSCQFIFNDDSSELATKLHWPKAPSRQLFEIIQQEVDKAIPKSEKELLPDLTEEQREQIILGTKQKHALVKKQWERKKDEFFFNTQADDVEEMVQCIHYLMNKCICSGNKELIKKCAVWAQKFADINEYLSLFLEKGGGVYERKDNTSKS